MSDRATARRQLKELASRILTVDDDEVLMITELACVEPGCPPIETVIAVLGPARTRQLKVHKPLVDITESDLRSALVTPHEH